MRPNILLLQLNSLIFNETVLVPFEINYNIHSTFEVIFSEPFTIITYMSNTRRLTCIHKTLYTTVASYPEDTIIHQS